MIKITKVRGDLTDGYKGYNGNTTDEIIKLFLTKPVKLFSKLNQMFFWILYRINTHILTVKINDFR